MTSVAQQHKELPRIDDGDALKVQREGQAYEEVEEDDDDDDDDSMDEEELEAVRALAVDDADWDLARGDFTKLYNRSRQIQSVAEGSSGSSVPLPAMNAPRRVIAAKEAREAANAASPSVSGSHSSKSKPNTNNEGQANASSQDQPTSSSTTPHDRTTAQLNSLSSYASRISLSSSISGSVPRKTGGSGAAGSSASTTREKDKADRATNQQVLDPRTLVILFKMLQRGFLEHIDGVISTGKEANVYHASLPPPLSEGETDATPLSERQLQKRGHVAIKIYKTSILVFKDRHQYVSGEFRFRNGYTGSNPRKMVKTWAEKEARNLKRLASAGVRAPKPLELRDHVLVMDFVGDDDGWASPRLKDAEKVIDQIDRERHDAAQESGQPPAGDSKWEFLYREMLVAIRTMWHSCRLVHADLSEYNVLYHSDGHLWIIDVSQSVEHDHPKALDFLRADIAHVEAYFAKRGGVRVMGLRKVFDWVLKEPSGLRRGGGGRVGVEQEREDDAYGDAAASASAEGGVKGPESTGSNVVETGGTGPFALLEVRQREAGESEDELMAELKTMMEASATSSKATPSSSSAAADTPSSTAGQDTTETASANANGSGSADSDRVFLSSYIPRTLNDVYDPERDIERLKRNKQDGVQGDGDAADGEGLIYAGGVTGLDEAQAKGAQPHSTKPEDGEGGEESGQDSSGSSSGSESSDEEDGERHPDRPPRGHRHEDRDAKKERKAAVKSAQKERRANKTSKKDKNKAIAKVDKKKGKK
ncbi:RIO1-domain-containing protein [Jaminaea rosea]|uniref:Serine/threonine-protein kinase RIO1 n=1 Tax=Jaminaea rosea TaxID=1569628 RepID=A0A316UPK8_9BASI|nr:RIO1-domain-containing protein [Jaminaea rosea]PWN25813.1 RIO1-domain-containing protein [Jaminaea rosea]